VVRASGACAGTGDVWSSLEGCRRCEDNFYVLVPVEALDVQAWVCAVGRRWMLSYSSADSYNALWPFSTPQTGRIFALRFLVHFWFLVRVCHIHHSRASLSSERRQVRNAGRFGRPSRRCHVGRLLAKWKTLATRIHGGCPPPLHTQRMVRRPRARAYAPVVGGGRVWRTHALKVLRAATQMQWGGTADGLLASLLDQVCHHSGTPRRTNKNSDVADVFPGPAPSARTLISVPLLWGCEAMNGVRGCDAPHAHKVTRTPIECAVAFFVDPSHKVSRYVPATPHRLLSFCWTAPS